MMFSVLFLYSRDLLLVFSSENTFGLLLSTQSTTLTFHVLEKVALRCQCYIGFYTCSGSIGKVFLLHRITHLQFLEMRVCLRVWFCILFCMRERKYRLPEVVDLPLRQPTTHRLLFDCRPCLFEVLFLVLHFHMIFFLPLGQM